MTRKKTKQKNSKKNTGIVKIPNLSSKSFLSNAFQITKKIKNLIKLKQSNLKN